MLELQVVVLGSVKQPFSECNLNVIVNVIGVFRGFPKFSQIDRNY